MYKHPYLRLFLAKLGLPVLSGFLVTTSASGAMLGDVTGWTNQGHTVTVSCGTPKVRIDFWADDVVRIWLSANGSFDYYSTNDMFMIRPGLDHFSGPTQFHISPTGEYINLESPALCVRVIKQPFGLAFYQADGQTLITATPAGQSLDTTVKAFLQRDAAVAEEHFVGLQFGGELFTPYNTLDHRGRTVSLEDRNGYGWASPFMMSSAGYGLFFNNEDGKNTRFTLTDPVVIENTATNGQMDLFFMKGPDFKHLLNLYTDLTGKPPMPPRKLMGLQYLVQGLPMSDEEAFPEWVDRGYPIDSCISFTDAEIETPAQMAGLAGVAQRVHARNGLLGFYYDAYAPGTFRQSGAEPTLAPYTNWCVFTNLVDTRLLDKGVDWFWIDETDNGWAPRFKFNLFNALKATTEAHDSRRPFLCARGGYAGCQQFGYPWMGDLDYDRTTVLANLCNGLAGFSFSTHDMSGVGVAWKTAPHFLAGVKTSFMNPFSQCNSWYPGLYPCHRPWEWSELVENVFHRFDELHYRLIPYFYSTAWQAHLTGMPVWRPLLLEYPGQSNVYASDEMMVGDWLLMAPMYEPTFRTVELPAGTWRYFFDGTLYTGPCTLTNFSPQIDQYPIFIKAGAIIPLAPPMQYVDQTPYDLTLYIDPYGTSSAVVYDDDGRTRGYQDGQYATTTVECVESGSMVTVTVHARTGAYVPPARNVILKVCSTSAPAQVLLGGMALDPIDTLEGLGNAAQGWCYAVDDLTGVFQAVIKLPDTGAAAAIQILRNPAAPMAPRQIGHVVFTKTDRATQAAWAGVYGSGGYWLGGTPYHVGLDSIVVTTHQASVTTCVPVSVSLYLRDSHTGGVATLNAQDHGTGRIMDSRTVTQSEGGLYLTYDVTRAADFTLINEGASDVVIAGVFFNSTSNAFCAYDAVASASFVEKDSWSQGTWSNRYGRLGYSLVGGGERLTNGCIVLYGGSAYVWGDNLDATNALQNPGRSGRIAACRYGTDLQVDVGVDGNAAQLISLYLLDWDGGGFRTMTIQAVNPTTGEVYDTRAVDNFEGGVYLRYAVKGHVRFLLSRTAGANAVVSGFFADPLLTPFEAWRSALFSSLYNPQADPEVDPDRDGLNNREEYEGGTDPKAGLPPRTITRMNGEGNGLRLTWYTEGNQTNIVQATTRLGADFTDISGPIILPARAGLITNYVDPTATNSRTRFYRIRQVP